MKRIHLHFGTHKTGSTSIQAYLAENSDFFASRGIAVMRDFDPLTDPAGVTRFGTNCFRVAHLAVRAELETPIRLNGDCGATTESARRAAIAAVNALLLSEVMPEIILSAEAFSFLRTAEEESLLREMFADTDLHPVGFFREKTDWLRSWAAQLERRGLVRAGQSETGIFDLSPDSWLVRHDDIRAFFGAEGTYHRYEDEIARNGSVLPAFLQAVGLDLSECPDWRGIWKNRSFGEST